MSAVRSGIPGGRAVEQRPPDLDAVKVGDEAVVVAHPQGHEVERGRVAGYGERDADVAACVAPVHLVVQVDVEVLLIAAASLQADAPCAADPGRVVEVGAASPGVTDGPRGHECALGRILSHQRCGLPGGRDGAGGTRVGAIERVEQGAAGVRIDEAHKAAGRNVASVREDLKWGDKLAIDPRASHLQPLLEVVDLALEAAEPRALAGPLLVVAGLGLANLVGH